MGDLVEFEGKFQAECTHNSLNKIVIVLYKKFSVYLPTFSLFC